MLKWISGELETVGGLAAGIAVLGVIFGWLEWLSSVIWIIFRYFSAKNLE
ncbi:MAG: hypothetical protein R3B93_15880 [Bacteroidia bacterium]